MTKNKKNRSADANALRVAPEYAGDGLAAALAGQAQGGASGESSSGEWVVFGVDMVAQIAAENAARASGQSLGQWLSDLIAETAAAKK